MLKIRNYGGGYILLLATPILLVSNVSGNESGRCTGEGGDNVAEGVYRMENRCTGRHITEALGAGEGCVPRPALLALPWPNSTQIDQVTTFYRLKID